MEIFGFTLTAGQLWLLGIVGTLGLNVLIFKLGLNQAKINRRAATAQAIRESLNAALADLPTAEQDWRSAEQAIKTLVHTASVASENFSPYLSIRRGIKMRSVAAHIQGSAASISRLQEEAPTDSPLARWKKRDQLNDVRHHKRELLLQTKVLLAYVQHS